MRTSNNANFIYSVHANHLEESHLAFVQAISMNLYKLDRFFFFLPTQKNLASCCSSFSNVYNIAKVFSSAALPFVHRSCQFSEDFPQFCNVTPPTSDKLKRAILQRKQNSEKMPKSNRQNACLKLHTLFSVSVLFYHYIFYAWKADCWPAYRMTDRSQTVEYTIHHWVEGTVALEEINSSSTTWMPLFPQVT